MKQSYREYYVDRILQELQKFSIYDRERGGFVRIALRQSNIPYSKQPMGELVGGIGSGGYLHIRLCGCLFKIHNLVWATEYGEWPTQNLDHFNQNKNDNRIENLRLGPQLINGKNCKMRSNNTSGYTGVRFDNIQGLYEASVGHNYKTYYCGRHTTPEKAAAARQAMIDAHPEWGFTPQHGVL